MGREELLLLLLLLLLSLLPDYYYGSRVITLRMPAINLLGSSHVGDNNSLPSAVTEEYRKAEDWFVHKFFLGTKMAIPGGRVSNSYLTRSFLDTALETAEEPRYDGQIVCLFLGTNDCASPQTTQEQFAQNYRNVVNRLWGIPHTAI